MDSEGVGRWRATETGQEQKTVMKNDTVILLFFHTCFAKFILALFETKSIMKNWYRVVSWEWQSPLLNHPRKYFWFFILCSKINCKTAVSYEISWICWYFKLHNISITLIRQTSSSVGHLSHSYLDAGIKGNANNESTSSLRNCIMILLWRAK